MAKGVVGFRVIKETEAGKGAIANLAFKDTTAVAPTGGRIMSSMAGHGGLAGKGGIAGTGGGLAG